jgi:hypothetical protein
MQAISNQLEKHRQEKCGPLSMGIGMILIQMFPQLLYLQTIAFNSNQLEKHRQEKCGPLSMGIGMIFSNIFIN